MEPKAELTLQFITMHLYISKATNILYYNIILLFKNMTLKCYKNIRFFFFFPSDTWRSVPPGQKAMMQEGLWRCLHIMVFSVCLQVCVCVCVVLT